MKKDSYYVVISEKAAHKRSQEAFKQAKVNFDRAQSAFRSRLEKVKAETAKRKESKRAIAVATEEERSFTSPSTSTTAIGCHGMPRPQATVTYTGRISGYHPATPSGIRHHRMQLFRRG